VCETCSTNWRDEVWLQTNPLEKLKGRYNLENLGLGGRIILKLTVLKLDMEVLENRTAPSFGVDKNKVRVQLVHTDGLQAVSCIHERE
jgi:hypothetical protein